MPTPRYRDLTTGSILLDFGLPGVNGMEAILAFRCTYTSTPIIVVSASDRQGYPRLVETAGVFGKDVVGAHLVQISFGLQTNIRANCFS